MIIYLTKMCVYINIYTYIHIHFFLTVDLLPAWLKHEFVTAAKICCNYLDDS